MLKCAKHNRKVFRTYQFRMFDVGYLAAKGVVDLCEIQRHGEEILSFRHLFCCHKRRNTYISKKQTQNNKIKSDSRPKQALDLPISFSSRSMAVWLFLTGSSGDNAA